MKYLLVFLSVFSLLSCQPDKGKEIPDVSHISVDIELRRFDQDFFKIDTTQWDAGLSQLEAKYPEFSKIFFDQILGSTDPRIAPQGHQRYTRGFATHVPTLQLYDTCQIVFPDMEKLEVEFEQAFQFFKYYFPNQTLPKTITTFISEYTIAAFVYGKNDLAVSLDFFLGSEYPYTEYNPGNPHFSQYLVRTFNKEHLVLKTIKPLLKDILGTPRGNRLLDHMIHNGKELYILDRILPHTPDTIITEYSSSQLKWVENSEKEIWHHFLREELLYSIDFQEFRKLVEYSPHSPGMPPEAPGRTANWIGWQIVEDYMKRYPESTFEELIALTDGQEILTKSKYKPAR